LKQFSDQLSSDVTEKQKYARWKVATIRKCLREGTPITPGPPEDETAAGDGERPSNQGPDTLSSSGSVPPPTLGSGAPAPSVSVPPPPVHMPATSGSSKSTLAASGISATSIDKAQKHAKFAVSALSFNDVPTAVDNLRTALALLTQSHE